MYLVISEPNLLSKKFKALGADQDEPVQEQYFTIFLRLIHSFSTLLEGKLKHLFFIT